MLVTKPGDTVTFEIDGRDESHTPLPRLANSTLDDGQGKNARHLTPRQSMQSYGLSTWHGMWLELLSKGVQ
jgi:hypothetical protein